MVEIPEPNIDVVVACFRDVDPKDLYYVDERG
jgi:hypothetical protein